MKLILFNIIVSLSILESLNLGPNKIIIGIFILLVIILNYFNSHYINYILKCLIIFLTYFISLGSIEALKYFVGIKMGDDIFVYDAIVIIINTFASLFILFKKEITVKADLLLIFLSISLYLTLFENWKFYLKVGELLYLFVMPLFFTINLIEYTKRIFVVKN